MKITAQEEYGLRCLLRLAAVPAGSEFPLGIRDIAEAEGLSVPYVAKLLAILRQAGLIESVRGRQGGYRLARPAEEISLGEALRVLGEPLFEESSYCENHASPEGHDTCVHSNDCAVRAVWRGLDDLIAGVLNRVSLAELLVPEEAMERAFAAPGRVPLPLSGGARDRPI